MELCKGEEGPMKVQLMHNKSARAPIMSFMREEVVLLHF